MKPERYLFTEEHIPQKGAFPVIDAHNHWWNETDPAFIVKVMDAVGVVSMSNVTANLFVPFMDGGMNTGETDISVFFTKCVQLFPDRFYGFTMATFAHTGDKPLFCDAKQFVDETIDILCKHIKAGARGLKILKELSLSHRNAAGELIAVDDPALSPIWEKAGELGVPVLIHQSDPYGFFEPVTPANEHYQSLQKYPSWNFADDKFPTKPELLERRDNLVRQHPNTTFILPHVANFAENLAYVGRLLDENRNVYIDFSARLDELGRQPYTAREFFIKYQDRILFGTDMPASVEVYRCHFRFLETFDEYFFAPDYDGTFSRHRWPICGIKLPEDALARIYYKNALEIIPGLKTDLEGKFENI